MSILLMWVSLGAQEPNPAATMASFCADLPRDEYKKLPAVASPDDWFELYQVAPGVTAIYEPHQWQETISYLIEGEHSALLFDTGNGIGDIKQVVETLTSKPLIVLNSHTHYDHVGGNYAFQTIYAMDTDFTRARQQGHSNAEIRVEVSAAALCRPLPKGINQHNHVGRPFTISKYVADGDKIDLGGRHLTVLALPGHTPDAIALIDRAAGLMWTGDTYYSGPIWLYAPETDLTAYAQSLDKLVAEVPNLKALLPAHNTPWVSPAVLYRVQAGFKKLLNGEASRQEQAGHTVIYKLAGEQEFSFLLRQGMLQD